MDATTERQAIVSAQVSPSEKRELERLAVEGDRTLSAQIRRILRRALADTRSTTTHTAGTP
jgi:hypothetical protein